MPLSAWQTKGIYYHVLKQILILRLRFIGMKKGDYFIGLRKPWTLPGHFDIRTIQV